MVGAGGGVENVVRCQPAEIAELDGSGIKYYVRCLQLEVKQRFITQT